MQRGTTFQFEFELPFPACIHIIVRSKMKISLLALFLTSVNLTADEQSWEIVQAVTEQFSDQAFKITVIIKNVASEDQFVPSDDHPRHVGMALPNSFLWPEGLTMKEAMRPAVSHYDIKNSRMCHEPSKQLTIRPEGEVSYITYDVSASVGKRLLLVFGEGESPNIIGAFTVPNQKKREQ